jgi:hypothetical protein
MNPSGPSGLNGSPGNFSTRSLNNAPAGNLNSGGSGGAGGGGGGGGRSGGGGGGGNQQKNNKNDKNDQNKQSSNFEPPSTDFNLGMSNQAPIDVKNALKANKDALRGPTTGIDDVNRQFKSIQSPKLGLPGSNESDDDAAPAPNPLAAGRPSSSSTRNGPKIADNSRTNNSLPTPGSNDFEKPNPGDLRAISPLPQAPVSPYLARYDYQTLMDRGRTLSPNAAVSNQSFTPPGDNTITTQRPKDPVVSYGSPKGQSRSSYGPGPGGPTGPAGFSGGSGSGYSSE